MNKKVFIVEDNDQLRDMYQQAFTSNGFECITESDSEHAMVHIREQKPDIILLDIMMPRVDGLTLLGNLKHDGELASIPVIMITNLPGPEVSKSALSQGAAAFLVKSDVKPHDIVEKVKSLLQLP